jgi:hypothetical protein
VDFARAGEGLAVVGLLLWFVRDHNVRTIAGVRSRPSNQADS